MSEVKTAEHNAPVAGGGHGPDHPVEFGSYLFRCGCVLAVVFCAVALMIWTSFLPEAHFSWAAKVCMIMAIAACNAFVVAGFLMHLISEKKMVYTLLGFTVAFVIGLFGLTIWAMSDFPRGTIIH
jgi:heme/copper-type cytochrome/quinol oxidase subunit 4